LCWRGQEEKVLSTSYSEPAEKGLGYDELLQYVYEDEKNMEKLQMGPILSTIRNYLKRQASPKEVFDTLQVSRSLPRTTSVSSSPSSYRIMALFLLRTWWTPKVRSCVACASLRPGLCYHRSS
jgi:hypothetical protein